MTASSQTLINRDLLGKSIKMVEAAHPQNVSRLAVARDAENAAAERDNFNSAAGYIEACMEKVERLFPGLEDDAGLLNDLQALKSRAALRAQP